MLNNITILGRLTADIDVKYTPSQVAVANFTVACERNYKEKDGKRAADFIECVAWRGTAENIEKFFHKGDVITVTGRLTTRTYEDRDGKKRKAVEVWVESFDFVPGTKKAEQAERTGEQIHDSFQAIDEDIPF